MDRSVLLVHVLNMYLSHTKVNLKADILQYPAHKIFPKIKHVQ